MAKTRRSYKGGAVSTTTNSSIASSGTTSFTITAYTGWPYGSDPFFVVVEPGTANEEKMLVTRTGSTDTTVNVYSTPTVAANRGLDGTSAAAHSSGATVYPVFTATDADEANELAATMTSKGDLISHSSTTFARLAVGTTGYVLKADSSATTGLAWGQVGTTGIADDAITAAKIATDAVGSAEIAAGAVGASELASDAVTTVKILDANVTAGKLASDSVTTAKIVDANVTAAKLATDSVTTAKIVDLNVTTGKIADTAVTAGKIASDAVTTAKILDSNVTTAKIADSAVTVAKLNLAELKIQSSAQAFAASTPDYILWDSEIADASGFISTTSNTITIPSGLTGLYVIGWRNNINTSSTGAFSQLMRNDVAVESTKNRFNGTSVVGGVSLYLAAGDTLKLYFDPASSSKSVDSILWLTRIMD